jgi:meiotic recombination protein SPO11
MANPREQTQQLDLVTRISSTLDAMQHSISLSQPLSFTIFSRHSYPPKPHKLAFPGRTLSEARHFAVVLKLLDIILHLLLSNRTLTKRDIFYQHIELFKSQSVVDRVVDDLACTFGVGRAGLNIVAASKGLVAGPVQLFLRDLRVMDCTMGEGGTLIPPKRDIARMEIGNGVEWVLIIEKEAVFRGLWKMSQSDPGWRNRGVLVTGKGYPDVATRELLLLLSEHEKEIPLYALVDLDPHGIDILAVYRFGSQAMAHEWRSLATDKLTWLGIKYQDLENAISRGQTGLLRLTQRDRQKAIEMLRRDYVHDDLMELKSTLQKILFVGVKAEIEIIEGFLMEWLRERLAPSRK